MQFDWFLSVLEQKRLENHDIYYIAAAELPLRFTHYHLKIMQFDWFLSVLEQKRLENHEIYHLEAAV